MIINLKRDHGRIIWAKVSPKMESWAAMVISCRKLNLTLREEEDKTWIWWVGYNCFSHLKNSLLNDFCTEYNNLAGKLVKTRRIGVLLAVKISSIHYGLNLPDSLVDDSDALISWAYENLSITTKNMTGTIRRNETYYIPLDIIESIKMLNAKIVLREIKNNINKVTAARNRGNKKNIANCDDSNTDYKNCTACCRYSFTSRKKNHPCFPTTLCDECYATMKNAVMPISYDNSNISCIICFSIFDKEFVLCDYCIRSYCTDCLNTYYGEMNTDNLIESETWKCFACSDEFLIFGLGRRKINEQLNRIYGFYPSVTQKKLGKKIDIKDLQIMALKDEQKVVQKVLNTLNWSHNLLESIDDYGIDGITKYSEQNHHVDVLIKYHPKSENYKATDSDGCDTMEEFLDFIRVKNIIENAREPGKKPLFWAFETNASITMGEKAYITKLCDNIEPILISLNVKTVRQRARFIWTNIPIVNRILEPFRKGNIFTVDKHYDVVANANKGSSSEWCYNSMFAILKGLKERCIN